MVKIRHFLEVTYMKLESEISEINFFFEVPPFEWCALNDGKANGNLIVKIFITANLAKLPVAIRKCPIYGRVELKNFTFDTSTMGILPVSDYRFHAMIYDSVDKEIASYTSHFKIQ
jgi:hypothetical protein